MTSQRIHGENRRFRGTGGLSENNGGAGFVPAFCDQETGRTELSRLPAGLPARIHLLGGLPEERVVRRDARGGILAVKATVTAGSVRDGRFYSREEAAQASVR
jgi:hypothetical protein